MNVTVEDIDTAIEEYRSKGFRLDMIFPADSPREALMSSDGEHLRLVRSAPAAGTGGLTFGIDGSDRSSAPADEWGTGRAGMEYRDLIPGRMDGRVIASHIRLTSDGEVPDYVHYHKLDFQMIYCLKGRIKVVYQDQGAPFWMEAGDCIVQPPEIRHRVLESTAGAEVVEVSMPAEHETWIDHETQLPNETEDIDREFSGQRFYRFQQSGSEPFVGSGYVEYLTDIHNISKQRLSVSLLSFVDRDNNSRTRGWFTGSMTRDLVFILEGSIETTDSEGLPNSFEPGKTFRQSDCFLLPRETAFTFNWSEDLKLLKVIVAD